MDAGAWVGARWEERRETAPGVAMGVGTDRAATLGMGGRLGRFRVVLGAASAPTAEAGTAGRVPAAAAALGASPAGRPAVVVVLLETTLDSPAAGPVTCVRVVMPMGVVTVIVVTASSSPRVETEHSIRYPGGRKVLNPWINAGCPRNRVLTCGRDTITGQLWAHSGRRGVPKWRGRTRSMTPGVSIPCDLKSFMIL